MIEHCTDIIDFFNECSALLKNDGVLSLAIPDKRFCFDFYRPLSTIQKAVDVYLQKNKIHTVGTVLEGALYHSRLNSDIPLDQNILAENIPVLVDNNLINAVNMLPELLKTDKYIDTHGWTFTKSSFELLIKDLNYFGFIDLDIIDSCPPSGCEFYVTLKKQKCINYNQDIRLKLLRQINDELKITL